MPTEMVQAEDKRKLTILVSSEPGNGKSTIAQEIFTLFDGLKFDIELYDEDARQQKKDFHEKILSALRNRIRIVVQTMPLRSKPADESDKVGVDDVRLTLKSFFYELARDHVVVGKINRVIGSSIPATRYTDKELAAWADMAAGRILHNCGNRTTPRGDK